jgi:hypothetical protein
MEDYMVRLNVNVSENIYEDLEDIAKKMNTTKSDVIRKSLSLIKLFSTAVNKDGGKFLIETKDGKLKEIVNL